MQFDSLDGQGSEPNCNDVCELMQVQQPCGSLKHELVEPLELTREFFKTCCRDLRSEIREPSRMNNKAETAFY